MFTNITKLTREKFTFQMRIHVRICSPANEKPKDTEKPSPYVPVNGALNREQHKKRKKNFFASHRIYSRKLLSDTRLRNDAGSCRNFRYPAPVRINFPTSNFSGTAIRRILRATRAFGKLFGCEIKNCRKEIVLVF